MLSCRNTETGKTVILLQRTIPQIIAAWEQNPEAFVCKDCGEPVKIKTSPVQKFAHKKYSRNCKFVRKREYAYRYR